jgi:flagellar biosynthesis/type III secretory pathway M-ring protein FliF/YscJ
MNTDIDELKKWNTKLITPLIVLSATAVIAIFAYFKHYPVGDWFVIVCASVVVFLIIGLIVEKMITRFVDINYEKAVAEREEARRLEEEARAAMEAEGEGLDVDDINVIQDENESMDQF